MSTPTSGDLLLVNRGGVNYQIDYDDMSTLQDTDLLLVNRAGVNYQIAASDINLGPDGLILPSVDVLTPVNGAGLDEGASYTPLSSAYVSTDSTPITYRHFPELITTVSGGSWVDENKMFNGSQSYFSELTGAAGVVSQAVFTPQTGWTEAQTTVWAYVTTGGTVEVLDETDTVLRSYALLTSFQEVGNDIGIVRANQKIRFTTTNQNESLFISRISGGPTDYTITGRVAFEFTDDTDLDKMVAPIIQTDENGNIKVPTTSTVDSTTTIPGDKKKWFYNFTGDGNDKTINAGSLGSSPGPVGERMLWLKTGGVSSSAISSRDMNGQYLLTSTGNAPYGNADSVQLEEEYTRLKTSSHLNQSGVMTHAVEIAAGPKLLDIVKYTGDNTNPREITHNLGTQPGMIIIKAINGASEWAVWHKDIRPERYLMLNNNNIQGGNVFPAWPTKDAFWVNNDLMVNSTREYIAYIFAAQTPGKVLCGTYKGDGSSFRTVGGLGSEPGFVLIKNISSSQDWVGVMPTMESSQVFFQPNKNDGLAGSSSYRVQTTSSYGGGFALHGGLQNDSGNTYVYLMVDKELTGQDSTQLNLLSGQDLEYFTTGTQITSNLAASGSKRSFGSTVYSGNNTEGAAKLPYLEGSAEWYDITSATGNKWLTWIKNTSTSVSHHLFDSERNGYSPIYSDYNQAEAYTTSNYLIPYESDINANVGYRVGTGNGVNESPDVYISWNFLAAPQFFDVQKYVGGGSAPIPHDLGTLPGCMIFKNTSSASDWIVWHKDLDIDKLLYLNAPLNQQSLFSSWVVPTTTGFTHNASTGAANQQNNFHISYLFAADSPYVKCGTYTGTGNNHTVNIGFKPRWILLKDIDNTYDWVVLDKELSMQFLRPNLTNAAEAVAWNFNSDGVELFSGMNTAWINNSGSNYIYVAIADESEGHPPLSPSSSTVTETPDPATATMVVNAESFDVGDSASAPALNASITSVAGVEGNSLLVDTSTGTWVPGLYAKGSETTVTAPSADEITFTSTNAGTTAFSGVDATLSSRTWTLESGPSTTGPWTVVDTYVDYDALNTQDGATPWSSNKPALAADTFYRVKVQYDSTNAESVESVYSTFKTSA